MITKKHFWEVVRNNIKRKERNFAWCNGIANVHEKCGCPYEQRCPLTFKKNGKIKKEISINKYIRDIKNKIKVLEEIEKL